MITAVGAAVLELTGIDLPPIVWSLIGAALLQGYSDVPVGRWRSIVQVTTSGMMGALLGLGLSHLAGVDHRIVTLMVCGICGAGAHPIISALVQRLVRKIESQEIVK